jgi:hypothetical protein
MSKSPDEADALLIRIPTMKWHAVRVASSGQRHAGHAPAGDGPPSQRSSRTSDNGDGRGELTDAAGSCEGMPQPTRVQALIARIHSLETHAAAIQQAFRSEALKTEAQVVIAILRVAADDLGGAPSEDTVQAVEGRLDLVAKRLSRLGGAT